VSSLTVLAAFLRRDFQINISYRANFATGTVEALMATPTSASLNVRKFTATS
jgi:ABC-type uncharacterized transport system permease subunit